MQKDEIIIYQSDDKSLHLEVRIEDETVWLNQAQMAELFQTTTQNITIHIRKIYKEAELKHDGTCKDFLQVQKEGLRTVKRKITVYNLDVIISVGYRVKSQRGTQFRIWANKILKDYLLKGYSVNQRFERIENKVDDSMLTMLSIRNNHVSALFYTANFNTQLALDLQKHNNQYPAIEIKTFEKSHDRFLIFDNNTLYHIGASLKDLGKKWFAFSKIELDANILLSKLV